MLLILCKIAINEAKNDQRVPRMICGKSKFYSARRFLFLFSLTIHTNPPGGSLVVGEQRPATKYI